MKAPGRVYAHLSQKNDKPMTNHCSIAGKIPMPRNTLLQFNDPVGRIAYVRQEKSEKAVPRWIS
ncbi:MAG: hypothetical protein ACRYGG_00180, partial [Janthinobacterium lividum]